MNESGGGQNNLASAPCDFGVAIGRACQRAVVMRRSRLFMRRLTSGPSTIAGTSWHVSTPRNIRRNFAWVSGGCNHTSWVARAGIAGHDGDGRGVARRARRNSTANTVAGRSGRPDKPTRAAVGPTVEAAGGFSKIG